MGAGSLALARCRHRRRFAAGEIAFWKQAGVTHVTAHTTYVSGHHKRTDGRSATEHLAMITRYRAAVADLL
jgi:hypothetical protein